MQNVGFLMTRLILSVTFGCTSICPAAFDIISQGLQQTNRGGLVKNPCKESLRSTSVNTKEKFIYHRSLCFVVVSLS